MSRVDNAMSALQGLELTDAQLEILGDRISDLVRQVIPRQRRLAKSRRQEQEGMQRFGGVRHPRSGARPDRKNDGHTPDELVEFKRTDNRRSITLQVHDLQQLESNALLEGRFPVLGFELAERRYVVIPERDYLDRVARPAQRSDGDPGPDLPRARRSARVVQTGQMPRKLRPPRDQPVLRRLPAQRSGPGGQVDLPGDPPRPSGPVPSDRGVPGARPPGRRTVGRVGRVLGAGASPDQEAATPCGS